MCTCVHAHTHVFLHYLAHSWACNFLLPASAEGYIFAASHFRAQIKGNLVPAVSEATVCNLKGTQTATLGEGSPYVP